MPEQYSTDITVKVMQIMFDICNLFAVEYIKKGIGSIPAGVI